MIRVIRLMNSPTAVQVRTTNRCVIRDNMCVIKGQYVYHVGTICMSYRDNMCVI